MRLSELDRTAYDRSDAPLDDGPNATGVTRGLASHCRSAPALPPLIHPSEIT